MNEIQKQKKLWDKFNLSKEFISLIWVGIWVFANGVTSFLVIAISSRKLNTPDLKNFLVAWNIINVSVLVLLSPLEALAPKLLREYKSAQQNLTFLKKRATRSITFLILVTVAVTFTNVIKLKIPEVIAITVFIIAIGKTYVVRSIFVAEGLYSTIAKMSILSALSTCMLFQLFYFSDQISVTSIFACTTLGTIIGIWSIKKILLKTTEKYSAEKIKSIEIIEKNIYQRLTQLSTTTFVELGLGMTGVTLLRFIGGTKNDIVMYAALTGLCSICFGFVNTAAVPMRRNVAIAAISGNMSQLKNLFYKNIVFFTLGLLAALLIIVISAPTYLQIIAGEQIKASKTRIVLTVLAIGLQTMMVVPKIVLIGIGRERQIMQIWLSGIVGYTTSLFLPINPYEKVCLAILISGFYIFVTGTALTFKRLSKPYEEAKVVDNKNKFFD